MMPTVSCEQAAVPPPSYHRAQVQAQAQRARALHINALTYTASFVVALAAWQAHRPDPIRSPKRVLAHLWEVSEL